ncbi:CxxC motif-containing protein [Lachnospiraceae bacterium NE2001]|nr:CxxC motif-containing protein [Lachnospiraceae bacterium NE2001]
MENKEFVCICCPMGCSLSVELDDAGNVTEVTGNTCNRGRDYAISEVTAPTRMVTTTVRSVEGVSIPVKTKEPIPKGKIFECMEDIKKAVVSLPVKVGDTIVSNVAGTGIDIVATRSL